MEIPAKASKREHRKIKFCSFILIALVESLPGYNHFTFIVVSGLWGEREIITFFFFFLTIEFGKKIRRLWSH